METILCNPANHGAARRLDDIRYIVIHYTANNGDTARNNGKYFARNVLTNKASAHCFVDEREMILSVGYDYVAYHCGAEKGMSYRHPECRNYNSIGIEICSRRDEDGVYYFLEGAVENAAALVRLLMSDFNIPIENVLRHYDVTGKMCPAPFVLDESAWESFLIKVQGTMPVDAQKVLIDVKGKRVGGLLINNTTYVPIRDIVAALNETVYWEEGSRSVRVE